MSVHDPPYIIREMYQSIITKILQKCVQAGKLLEQTQIRLSNREYIIYIFGLQDKNNWYSFGTSTFKEFLAWLVKTGYG